MIMQIDWWLLLLIDFDNGVWRFIDENWLWLMINDNDYHRLSFIMIVDQMTDHGWSYNIPPVEPLHDQNPKISDLLIANQLVINCWPVGNQLLTIAH